MRRPVCSTSAAAKSTSYQLPLSSAPPQPLTEPPVPVGSGAQRCLQGHAQHMRTDSQHQCTAQDQQVAGTVEWGEQGCAVEKRSAQCAAQTVKQVRSPGWSCGLGIGALGLLTVAMPSPGAWSRLMSSGVSGTYFSPVTELAGFLADVQLCPRAVASRTGPSSSKCLVSLCPHTTPPPFPSRTSHAKAPGSRGGHQEVR